MAYTKDPILILGSVPILDTQVQLCLYITIVFSGRYGNITALSSLVRVEDGLVMSQIRLL